MSQERVLRCDACGRTKLVGENTENPWTTLQTIIGSPEEYAAVAEQVQEGVPLENVIDAGDFCSLACVANWASARHEMRVVSKEVTGEPDTP